MHTYRIDYASSGRDATESIIQRVEGGGQETFCCRGFGGANNLPGDFQTFFYTLNGSHSNTAGTMEKGGVQNRFTGTLFSVLVFIRALFYYFQREREMHEKQHFDKTNTLCIQISLILQVPFQKRTAFLKWYLQDNYLISKELAGIRG